ncbi:hypothetical protein N2152v2_007220 [Parachlorella kessleri]
MKGHRDIASFFGGKPLAKAPRTEAPKASGGKDSDAAPAKTSSGKKAKSSTPAAAAPVAEQVQSAGSSRKRLRKAGEVAGDDKAPVTAAAGLEDLEDGSPQKQEQQQEEQKAAAQDSSQAVVEAAKPAAKKRARRSPSPATAGGSSLAEPDLDAEQTAGVARALAKEIAEEEEEERLEEADSSPESEAEGPPAAKAKKEKKALGKAAGKSKTAGKVDGVGKGAVTAAAEHSAFDLSKLATWEAGKPVPFSFLADTFEAIADEPKRLAITGLLIRAFRTVVATTPEDLLPIVYLCTNRVAPAHEGLELGIGDATLIKALSQATGRKEDRIKQEYDESGDLGVVATSARATQRTMFPPPPLTVRNVFKTFREIAETTGSHSQDKKKGLIVKLVVGAKQNEAGYIMRALQGKLRIGLAEQTVLVALAHAVALQRGEDVKGATHETIAGRLGRAADLVKQVYSECPSYNELIPALLNHPLEELPLHVHFKPGVPVKPMLAKPTTGVTEVLDKFTDQEFTCEYKYDGERAQIHVTEDGKVSIYSRNSEDNTGKYPDVAALVPKLLKPGVASVVFDAEAVAFDREQGKVLPFQVLSTRARKDVTMESIKVNVCIFAFDCLYLNGKALLREPLTARREALHEALSTQPGVLELATTKTSRDVEELQTFLDESVAAGTEGLIVKTLADSYEPSKRSSHWLKLKKDYMSGVGDTFDVVPIGAWYGKGKRVGVFGSYLLAVYNADEEEYQTISKIGTGFSEEMLKQLADGLRDHVIQQPRPYYRYGETLIPDVWFDAKAVWEVKAADLSISPVHRAAQGLVDDSKGISIRFPRLVRVRDDKGPEDATSAEQVAEMYRRQAVHQQKGKAAPASDDY